MNATIQEIIEREKTHEATSIEIRAGMELAKAESMITSLESNLHLARERARLTKRWIELYANGELSPEAAMTQITIEADGTLAEPT